MSEPVDQFKQYIAFEGLRAGSYRPSCSVEIVGPPERTQVLFRFLDIKHREVLPREHSAKWPLVLKAMQQQFVPSVRKPIDVAEVLRLVEEEVERERVNNINYSVALAVLNAHVGKSQRAVSWCNRAEQQAAERGTAIAEWESRQMQFLKRLQEAIALRDGTAPLP